VLHDTPVNYVLYNSAGVQIGSGQQTLVPGKIVRLLDIFAAVGLPTGDYDNAMLKVVENGPDEPGVIAFCTVQDNTSFAPISESPSRSSPTAATMRSVVAWWVRRACSTGGSCCGRRTSRAARS
jgi:hypothetical protein